MSPTAWCLGQKRWQDREDAEGFGFTGTFLGIVGIVFSY